MTRTSSILLVASALLMAACGGDEGHPDDQHSGCSVRYNSVWQSSGLVLIHDDQRDCPVGVPQGGTAYTGGVIVDTKPTFPHTDGNYDAYGAELTVWSNIHDESTLLAEQFEFFYFGFAVYNQSKDYEWQTDISVSYTTADNPDYALFIVEWQNLTTTPAEALMEIGYFGTQF